ncbi:hypothetical protein D0C36_08505 [Mucilaginibacter conchicola]|uniref:Uncharacterized protein n=1 Tax=Mucilaginibacter conchicola TaxID=2303333 RepID=A0A372NZK5_9SPHI|nr:hypothetical protein [Mucilaginibacter conchicola]RFZ95546.1 hypothetical protein D0C36_08505 [Mucilaginibacter conchicola]
MITLKRIKQTDAERQQLEQAMRKRALKRSLPLDYQSAQSDIGSDKLFVGYDGKKNVQFSRLRTSLERFLPRVVIVFSKDPTVFEYKLRYSLLSTIAVIFLALVFILSVVSSLAEKDDYDRFVLPLFLIGCFWLLTLFELKIVGKRIKKALPVKD